MKRGAVQKNQSRAIIVWFPIELVAGMDTAVRRTDLDRSKFIRLAVREKMAATGGPR